MKVFVQIVDTFNGIFQSGMIDEPIQEGFEVNNALKHFGLEYGEINWEPKVNYYTGTSSSTIMRGFVSGASKVVNIVTK